MTPSLRLFLAEEHASVQAWLPAYVNATQCRSEAVTDSTLPHRHSLLARCGRIEAHAAPHVAFVVVRPPPNAAGLRVQVAGVELPSALWNVSYPVAASTLVIDATTTDGRTFHQELPMSGGQTREVSVVLPAPSSPPPPPPPSPPAPPRPVVVSVVRTPPPPPPPASGPGAAPWIVAGAGVVVLGSAGVFFALRESSVSERDAACRDAATCTESGDVQARAADSIARTYNLLTDVALGVGGAAVVGGAVWWLLARPSSRPTVSAWLAPHGDRVLLGVGGTF